MTREQMIESLALVAEHALYLDGDADGRYLDWSCGNPDEGTRTLEVGDGAEAVQFDLTRDEIVRLHAALTATLLADGA